LNEKADDEGVYESVADRDVDLNSSQLNLNEKADDAYHSEDEQYEAGQSGLNSSEIEIGQNAQRVGGPSGPWGTSFLKDCRSTQTGRDEPSNSGRVLGNGSVASSHDDMDGSGEDDDLNRGHGDVPAEEMLSDDYYEQDEEDQIESLNRRGMSHPSCSNSAVAAKSVPSRQNKSTKRSAYDDDDDENDNDDDDDDADGIFIPAPCDQRN
jgi:chromodomain-helicase-DNA-binding protein 1